MALEKLKDLTGKYSNGMQRGRNRVEQIGAVVQAVRSVKHAIGGGNGQSDGAFGKAAEKARDMASKFGGDVAGKEQRTSRIIQEFTDVAVPRRTTYNQWTQFTEFGSIMKGVETVAQVDDDKLSWNAKIGPVRRQWHTEIVEQVPDERIAWRTRGGVTINGVVTFHSLDERLTRIMVQMEYQPNGLLEWVGNLLRVQRRRARRDLRLFKHHLEMAGHETGSWRGRISKGPGSRSGTSSDGGNGQRRGRPSRAGTPRRGSARARSPRRTGTSRRSTARRSTRTSQAKRRST